jgi:hypothetical protein
MGILTKGIRDVRTRMHIRDRNVAGPSAPATSQLLRADRNNARVARGKEGRDASIINYPPAASLFGSPPACVRATETCWPSFPPGFCQRAATPRSVVIKRAVGPKRLARETHPSRDRPACPARLFFLEYIFYILFNGARARA